MPGLTADLLNLVSHRSLADREALLDYLAADVISQKSIEVRSIQNEHQQTVGFLVPHHPSQAWQAVFSDPAVIMELKHRLENPGPTMTLEEIIEEIESETAQPRS